MLESTANGSGRRRLGARCRRRLPAGQRPPARGTQPGDASRPSNARHGDAPIGATPIDGTCAWWCLRPRLMAHAAAPSVCREARSSGPWRGCRASTPRRAAPPAWLLGATAPPVKEMGRPDSDALRRARRGLALQRGTLCGVDRVVPYILAMRRC